MSDKFDPDAWPYSTEETTTPGGSGQTTRRTDDDDAYDPLDFDTSDENYSDPQTSDDFGYDDEPTTGSHARDDQPADDDFSSFDDNLNDFGNDDFDDDDFNGTYDSYDDDYDDDFNGDNEGNGGGGLGRKLLGALAVILVVLAVGAGAKAVLGGGGDNTATTQTTQTSGTADPNATTNTSSGDPAATTPPAQVPKEVVDAMNAALTAWGQFAVDGNLETVRPYFLNDGPQFDRFQVESPEIKAKATGGPAFSFAMSSDAQWTSTEDGNWVAKGTVTVSSPGKRQQTYPWEITVSRLTENEPWKVWSVRQY